MDQQWFRELFEYATELRELNRDLLARVKV